MRRPFIAGNWKMNLERASALSLCSALREGLARRGDVDAAVFPPFVYLAEVVRALEGTAIRVGAQNCCDERSGAFTGEVGAAMIADVGATMVILGHSERRHLYGEGDELVNAKLGVALDTGLDAILCVGETLAERQENRTEKVIGRQLQQGLAGVSERQLARVTIAYEPVWAIGTGQTATPKQAGEAHGYLRGVLGGLYSPPVAETVRIQYGGSVKPSNVKELMAVPEVDGCLVGGACLQAETFLPLFSFR